MRILLLIHLLFCFICATAQNVEADSLKKLLVTLPEDSRRINVLESLSYAYLGTSPDTALRYATEALQLSKDIGSRKGEAISFNALGNVYFHLGNYARSLEMYLDYLVIKEELKEFDNLSIAYFNIASVYTEQEDYEHALFYLFKAKQQDEKAQDSSAILYDLYSLGSIYLRMGEKDSALLYTTQSYQLSKKLDDKNMIGAVLNTLGEVYLSLGDLATAAKYYDLSIPYAGAINDNEVLTANYFGLAKVFEKKNMPDSSLHHARKALSIARPALFSKQVLEVSTFITNLFSSLQKYDSAFHYQQLSIATKDSLFNIEELKKVQNFKFQEQQRQQSIETAGIKYRNKVNLFIASFVSAIILMIAVMLWRNNKQKRKANNLLLQEKEKVERTLAELKSTQSQLIQSEKMASLGELTAGIAHELQNPLNFVNNFSEVNEELLIEMKDEMQKGNYDNAKEIADDVIDNEEKINHHGKRAGDIIKAMFQHSRGSTGVKEPTDINALCDEYLRLAYHGLRAKDKSLSAGQAGFNATINTDYDKTLGKVNVIPQDIGRVVLNLINNAFYATVEKKKQRQGGYEPAVTITTKQWGGTVSISVKDNGNGIPESIKDKIFQPFFTTKPTGQGTGLGLSLSYDIVKAHGGELRVETKEGEGSAFSVRLPLV